ncbi:unnamed protein product [Cylicostephanus goldi]|uniref:Uncharacterized protein n=1 Tax=Cylicostephanus goldi TaxID=71465 RepID=A0A3P7MSE3_CYLGO|nr:unnamed protein product [Cylicostephanus goldi]
MWLLLLLPVFVAAAAMRELVYVGQVYQKPLSQKTVVSAAGGLPAWLLVRDGVLQGIPTKDDVGKHTLKISTQSKPVSVLELIVKEDNRNPCGSEDTYWVEALYEEDGPVEDRLDAALDVAEALKVDVSELKVLSYNYSRTIRSVEAIGGDEVAAYTVMKKVACGDDLETAASEMDAFLTAVESIEYDYVVVSFRL